MAQLRAALRRVGADAAAFIPHRLRDGYGLRPDTVRRVLAELSPSVIVTVDCGITAREGVACARAAGVDVIVTDHHLVPRELPEGAIVVNPRQPGCDIPYKDLAAAGIALKLAEAVGRRAGVSLSVTRCCGRRPSGRSRTWSPWPGRIASSRRGGSPRCRPRAPGLARSPAESGGFAPEPLRPRKRSPSASPRDSTPPAASTRRSSRSRCSRSGTRPAGEIARELSARNGNAVDRAARVRRGSRTRHRGAVRPSATR